MLYDTTCHRDQTSPPHGAINLPQEVHTARAQTRFRRSVTHVHGSTFQPAVGAVGQLFARMGQPFLILAYAMMTPLPSLRALPKDRDVGVHYVLFFDEGSRGNPEQVGLDPSSSNCTFRCKPYASCGWRACHKALLILPTISRNTKG